MRYNKLYLLFLFSLVLLTSCTPKKNNDFSSFNKVDFKYATGLNIYESGDYTVVDVKNPWDSSALLQRYILVDINKKGIKIPEGTVIYTPVKHLAVYSSVHASVIDMLGEVSSIKGVCEGNYMDVQSIKDGLVDGSIRDFGNSMSPNIEQMIGYGIEGIIATPFQNGSYGSASQLGIPIIEGAEYMELHPLGRTEWIKFYSRLFNKAVEGDSLFNISETRYNYLKSLVHSKINDTAKIFPTVMSEKKYGSQWNVPGGNSYIATLYKDAGADYIYSSDKTAGNLALSVETMIEKGISTDIWLVKYNSPIELSYKELKEEFEPYANFKSWKNKKIYGCNTGKVPYYAETTMHPDYLLEDFVMIFHPELLPKGKMRFFAPLQ